MLKFKTFCEEKEKDIPSGFMLNKDGTISVVHDTSNSKRKKSVNENLLKKIFGKGKADHEKSLADHAAEHNKEDHGAYLSSHSAEAHKDPHEAKAFDHFKRNSQDMNEHLINSHKKGVDHGYSKTAASSHKQFGKKHSHMDDHETFPNNSQMRNIEASEAHLHHTIHKHSKPLGKKITLYHGSHHDFGAAAKKSKGGIIHSPAHMSTSHDHKSATDFGSGHVVVIHADKKTKAVHVSGKGSKSAFSGEKETIIPSGTKLKHIKSHKTKDGYDVHHFKVHSQHDNGNDYDQH